MNLLSKMLENPNLGAMKYIERRPVREYVDGKASDTVVGYKYICVLPQMGYAQVAVKVMGAPQLDEPAQPYDVVCDGLTAIAYVNGNNRADVAFRAEKIHPAKG